MEKGQFWTKKPHKGKSIYIYIRKSTDDNSSFCSKLC